jgi:hypothetical protein
MPRFCDDWLIDRTLFDYIQGGSCACCSFNFLPNGTKGLIESLSEFETDAAEQEVNALDVLPWPPDMKQEVWVERVRLRQFCKQQMKEYQHFWHDHGDTFTEWFLSLSDSHLQRLFQLPRSEIVERLKVQKYQIHAAFGSVLCAVTEQVAHFEVTQYPPDGRGEAELGFEGCLTFDRRSGFTLKHLEAQETKDAWLLRHQTLGGPKLLERNAKKPKVRIEDTDGTSSDEDERAEKGDNVDVVVSTTHHSLSVVPSFRSDRRILRLIIARHFADVLQRAFLKDREERLALDKVATS